jgi:hypothetical protein
MAESSAARLRSDVYNYEFHFKQELGYQAADGMFSHNNNAI